MYEPLMLYNRTNNMEVPYQWTEIVVLDNPASIWYNIN